MESSSDLEPAIQPDLIIKISVPRAIEGVWGQYKSYRSKEAAFGCKCGRLVVDFLLRGSSCVSLMFAKFFSTVTFVNTVRL